MDRRATLKWVLAASAVGPLMRPRDAQAFSTASVKGYGTDPDLSLSHRDLTPWPLTLSAAQRRLAGTLADLIIPADEHSPCATAAGVVDFIDEWVSAPYADFQRDRGIVLGGFLWLDQESGRRCGRDFIELEAAAQAGVCDDICATPQVGARLREAAAFFARFRDLTAGGFYCSPMGRQDLNYIGNVPLVNFAGPPRELLQSLGLV